MANNAPKIGRPVMIFTLDGCVPVPPVWQPVHMAENVNVQTQPIDSFAGQVIREDGQPLFVASNTSKRLPVTVAWRAAPGQVLRCATLLPGAVAYCRPHSPCEPMRAWACWAPGPDGWQQVPQPFLATSFCVLEVCSLADVDRMMAHLGANPC